MREEALQRQPLPRVQGTAQHDDARVVHFNQPMTAVLCSKGGCAIITPKALIPGLIWVTVVSDHEKWWREAAEVLQVASRGR